MRAFTMIELCIVVVIMALLTTSFLSQFLMEYSYFHGILAQVDQRNEVTLAAARAFQHARGGVKLDPDNHGLVCKDGYTLRQDGQRVCSQDAVRPKRSLVSDPIVDFTAIRQGSNLTLSFVVANSRVVSRGAKPCRYCFSSGLDVGP